MEPSIDIASPVPTGSSLKTLEYRLDCSGGLIRFEPAPPGVYVKLPRKRSECIGLREKWQLLSSSRFLDFPYTNPPLQAVRPHSTLVRTALRYPIVVGVVKSNASGATSDASLTAPSGW